MVVTVMAKRKRHFQDQLQFLSNLPLQECVSRLEQLNGDNIQIVFHRDSIDSLAFSANLLERGVIRAKAQGLLRRWEGTLTRVDCKVKVHEGVIRWLILVSLLFFVLVIGFPMIFMLGALMHMLLWLGISAIFVIAFVASLWLTMHYAPMDDTPKNLMQIVLAALDE